MQQLIKIATNELGVKEVSGAAHSPRVLQYAQEAGFKEIKDDETPWCSMFLSWCCLQAGLQRSKAPNARSWLNVGQATATPEPGDIVVYWRNKPDSWEGHVGIYLGVSIDGKRIYTLGGNQANMVNITGYDAANVLGYRRVAPMEMVILPAPPLQSGSKGTAVAQLQDVLKALNIEVGVSDGIFGNKTDAGIRSVQSRSGTLPITGIYDQATKSYLESVLQS